MTRLYPLEEDSEATQEMVAALLPRGPIWQERNADVAGMTAGLGDEARRFHNRMVDLMSEAYPATAEEIIAEWESTYGLPICADAPTDLASRQAAVAGAYAAQGGQDRAYFIAMIRAVLGDPAAAVTITERPYGRPFRAWASSAWDAATGVAAMHYWRVTLPSGTSPALVHVVGCLLDRYKPAHTVVELVAGVTAYYSSPGGAGDWAHASTPVAARLFFSGSGAKPVVTFLCWARKADGSDFATLFDTTSEYDDTRAKLQITDDPLLSYAVRNAAGGEAVNDLTAPAPGADWHFYAFTCDGTDVTLYLDGVEVDSQALPATTYSVTDLFAIFTALDTSDGAEADERNIAIFDRALSADEVAALYSVTDAEAHDYRAPAGDDWPGEVPAVYWCTAAVARLMWSYYTEDQGLLTVENPIVSGDATVLFWLSVESADEGEHIVQGPFELIISAGGGGFAVGLDAGFDAAVYARAALHQFAVVANGTDHKLYVDGVLRITNVDAASFVGDLEFFGAFALPSARYTIVNPAIFGRDLSADEITDLYAAGSPHDYRVSAGDDWAGEVPVGYWRDDPVGGVVASIGSDTALTLTLDTDCTAAAVEGSGLRVISSGSAGVCDLNLYANVTSEED